MRVCIGNVVTIFSVVLRRVAVGFFDALNVVSSAARRGGRPSTVNTHPAGRCGSYPIAVAKTR